MSDTPTLFGDFVILMKYATEESLADALKRLNEAERPEWLGKHQCPQDLNMIAFGQYSDICDAIGNENHIEAMKEIVRAMFDVSDDEIDTMYAYDVWGFCNFAIKEVDRINKLFSAVHLEYTEQERKAGIDKLQFGTFGILDWYARRMGIVDQNLVNQEKWVRIYQCMKNDTDEAAYNRRLQKVYEAEAKRKH